MVGVASEAEGRPAVGRWTTAIICCVTNLVLNEAKDEKMASTAKYSVREFDYATFNERRLDVAVRRLV